MAEVRFSDAALADIAEVLAFTLESFGPRKLEHYRSLLRDARARLAQDPLAGRAAPDIHPKLRIYRIAKVGRNARHVLLYTVSSAGMVHVVRFLYDAMDFGRHLSQDFGQEEKP